MKLSIPDNATKDDLIDIINSLHYLVCQQKNYARQIEAQVYHANREYSEIESRIGKRSQEVLKALNPDTVAKGKSAKTIIQGN